MKKNTNINEKTRTTYMRIALGLCGVVVNEPTAELIWRINDGVLEKGKDFSLRDAVDVDTFVCKKYKIKSIGERKSNHEPEKQKEDKKKVASKKRKTVREWLETLKEPYRSKALINLGQSNCIQHESWIASSLSQALKLAFNWKGTKEGVPYWEKLYNKILKEE